jgi:hypothetical protein
MTLKVQEWHALWPEKWCGQPAETQSVTDGENLRIGYLRQRRKVGQQSLRYSVAGSYRICSILLNIRICASNT